MVVVEIITGVFGFIFTLIGWILWLVVALPFKLLGVLFTALGPYAFLFIALGLIVLVLFVGGVYLFRTQYCKLPFVVKENEVLKTAATYLGVTCDGSETPVVGAGGNIDVGSGVVASAVGSVGNVVAETGAGITGRDAGADVESTDMGLYTPFRGCPSGQYPRLARCRKCPDGYRPNVVGTKCRRVEGFEDFYPTDM